jgi:type I restriction enzyme S subunit
MALTKLGIYIKQSDIRNTDGRYGEEAVIGLSTQKSIIETKAELRGVNLTSYKLVPPRHFAYVPDTSRRGDKMSLAYNFSEKTYLVSSISVVFSVKKSEFLSAEFLFMYFNRPEFDRYARFNSWGSARETFSWEEMCDIDIKLPPLPIQQKYVDVYEAMLANQQSYERGLEDLKLTLEIEIDKIKHTAPRFSVGSLLKVVDIRNSKGLITDIQGINITKNLMSSTANVSKKSLEGYKVVKKGQFAYSPMQTGRDECIRIALYQGDVPIVVSPAYSVFQVKNEKVLAEYIMLWFSRKESDRYGWFASDSSIRASLDAVHFFEIKIPVPSIKLQEAIAEIYTAYRMRREINERLKEQIKEMCPILIKGSLEEATI